MSGRYAYLAAGSEGLEVVDWTDPAAPQAVGRYPGEYVKAVAVAGSTAWIMTGTQGLEAIDVSDPTQPQRGELQVIDVSDPANPRPIAIHPTDGWAVDLAVMENLVCLLTRSSSMSHSGGQLNLSWEGFGPVRLEQATRLTDPDWQDLGAPETVDDWTLPASHDPRFFRLVRP